MDDQNEEYHKKVNEYFSVRATTNVPEAVSTMVREGVSPETSNEIPLVHNAASGTRETSAVPVPLHTEQSTRRNGNFAPMRTVPSRPASARPAGPPAQSSTMSRVPLSRPSQAVTTAIEQHVRSTQQAQRVANTVSSGNRLAHHTSAQQQTRRPEDENRMFQSSRNPPSRFGSWRPQHQQSWNSTSRPTFRPRIPSPTTTTREANERRDREGRERAARNFVLPDDPRSIISPKSVTLNDLHGFLEQHQREMNLTPALNQQRSSPTRSLGMTVADESSWVEDYESDSTMTFEEFNVNEPTLASSRPVFTPQLSLPVLTNLEIRDEDSQRAMQPQVPSDRTYRQPLGFLSRHRDSERPMQSPPQRFPTRPSSGTSEAPAVQNARREAQPQILVPLQNLPDIDFHDASDIWGLRNETVALSDSEQPENRISQQNVQELRPILRRRPNDIPPEQLVRNEELEVRIDVLGLKPESLDEMSRKELSKIVDALYYGSPREKFKLSYPFLAEGVVQKDSQISGQLRVFSSRVGKVNIPDSHERGNNDYVYFIVRGEGDYCGLTFVPHPTSLISTKFPSENTIVINGYAILGNAKNKSANRVEENWLCWSDALGLMRVICGSARIPLKKHGSEWDREVDVVKFYASFENNRFIVKTISVLTNFEEKKSHFPEEPFLAEDLMFKMKKGDDFIFKSESLDLTVSMKQTLMNGVEEDVRRRYEIVVVPTFPKSTTLVFEGILMIPNEDFWTGKEWAREKLLKRMEDYRNDANAARIGGSTNAGAARRSRPQLPPRAK